MKTKKLGPFYLKYEGRSWFLFYKGQFFARYNPRPRIGYAQFKLSAGRWIVEMYPAEKKEEHRAKDQV